MNKVCDLCLGLAIGMVGGMVIASIPQVKVFVKDMKNVFDKDVVAPMTKMMEEKKNSADTVVGA